MLRSAPRFAAWCAADPGSMSSSTHAHGSRLCGAPPKRRCTASGTRHRAVERISKGTGAA